MEQAHPPEAGTPPIQGVAVLQALLQALPAAIYATDTEGRVIFHNAAAEALAARAVTPGMDWREVWPLQAPDGSPVPAVQCPTARALAGNGAVTGFEATTQRADGMRVAVVAHAAALRDSAGTVTGVSTLLVELGPRHEIDARRRAQWREIDHRIKNAMQVLQSLVGAAQREARNEETRAVLGDVNRRIGAVAQAQDVMHDATPPVFSVRPFLESLCRTASQTFARTADIAIAEVSGTLPNRAAVPLALILSELITNAVRHARGERSRVCVTVSFSPEEEAGLLTVRDDGPGFVCAPPRRGASGLGLVSGLARQMGGALEVISENGASVRVRFALPHPGREGVAPF